MIAPEWVVTAAHCLVDFEAAELVILEGTHSLLIADDDSDPDNAIPESALPGNRIFVDAIVRHFSYDFVSFDSDLALIKLRTAATENIIDDCIVVAAA